MMERYLTGVERRSAPYETIVGKAMYKIGDFSLVSRVSIKMLRHYDEIGLFTPAHIDRFTSYRYYTLDQLPLLNRIMALKDMGFSLAEVAQLVNQPLSPDDMQTLLDSKQAELESQLTRVQDRLARLRTWTKRIEIEGKMPEYEITLKPIPKMTPPLPPAPGQEMITRPFPGKAGLERDIVFSTADQPMPDVLACVVHQGSEDTLVQAYLALDQWITENGYEIAGSPQEIYLAVDEENADASVTEVQMPIRKK